MASYVVMEPPRKAGGAMEPVLIRDGFHWLAFLVPPLWFLWHGMWLAFLLAALVMAGLGFAGDHAGLGAVAAALSLLVSLYAGLEGAALRCAALRRRGWNDAGTVVAETLPEAEIRYGAGTITLAEDAVPVAVAPAHPVVPGAPALGLFSYPGRH